MIYTKQEMYDCLYKTVYLKMVEQFLPNLKQAPEGMFFAETDLDQLVDLSHQARMIADIGTDIHALGLVDKNHLRGIADTSTHRKQRQSQILNTGTNSGRRVRGRLGGFLFGSADPGTICVYDIARRTTDGVA
jgi:hypothetical protein